MTRNMKKVKVEGVDYVDVTINDVTLQITEHESVNSSDWIPINEYNKRVDYAVELVENMKPNYDESPDEFICRKNVVYYDIIENGV